MKLWIAAAALLAALPASTSSDALTVKSTDNIYGVGQTSAPGGGTVPATAQKLGLTAKCVTIAKVRGSIACSAKHGCIILNHGTGDTPNDADGVGAASGSSSNSGTAMISGMTAPNAGYLVGLFTTGKGPKGTAPAALDFTTGKGTGFASISPALDQTFFIGDGLTRDHRGTQQTFMVPQGARKLWLGISDACGYHGGPGCYDDNLGSYRVSVTVHNDTCP